MHIELASSLVAPAPYLPSRRTPSFVLHQFVGLIRVLLAEYRTNWFIFMLFGGLMPLGMIFLFKYAGMGITPEKAVFLIGGNMTTAVIFGPTMMLIGKIGWGRENRTFDYWATLPIGKLTLLLAITTVSMLFALPGVLAVFLVGAAMLGVPLISGLWLLPLIPLGCLSLSGLGGFLGTYAKDGQTANNYGNILMSVVIFLSPMMMPQATMPLPLRLFSYIMPPTYVADAFRSVLAGQVGARLWLDLALVAASTVGFLALAHRKLDWRNA